MSSVAPKAAATGDAQASESDGRLVAEKPMLVYVTAADDTDVFTRKLEDISLKDERVAIGSKFFRCVKISADSAAQDRLLKEHGKSAPRLILVKRNYEVVGVIESKKLSPSRINKAMAKLAKEEYTNSFSTMLGKYAKLLNELDRLDDVRSKLAADSTRYNEDPKKYAAKLKKLAKEQSAFEKSMEEWKAEEAKLLELKLVETRPATS
jgi:hypothetical protein